jgi:hypothetical protein
MALVSNSSERAFFIAADSFNGTSAFVFMTLSVASKAVAYSVRNGHQSAGRASKRTAGRVDEEEELMTEPATARG